MPYTSDQTRFQQNESPYYPQTQYPQPEDLSQYEKPVIYEEPAFVEEYTEETKHPEQNIKPPPMKNQEEDNQKEDEVNFQDKALDMDAEIPSFPFDIDESEEEISEENIAEEKEKNEYIPDYFEPIDSIFPEKLTEDIPIEEPIEPLSGERKNDENKINRNNKSIVNLGVLHFGPPKPEVVKNLLTYKPKSIDEKKDFLSKSVKELGKFLFSEITTLPKEIQEKATLSKNFQTFVQFMKKEKETKNA